MPSGWRRPTRPTPATNATCRSPTTSWGSSWTASGNGVRRPERPLRAVPRHRRAVGARPTRPTPASNATCRSPTTSWGLGSSVRGDQVRPAVSTSRLSPVDQLAEAEPANTGYQRDLSVSYNRLGDLDSVRGVGRPAVSTSRLWPWPSGWRGRAGQHRLPTRPVHLVQQVGRLELGNGRYGSSPPLLRTSLAVIERLAETDPTNTGFQRDLSIFCAAAGDLAERDVEPAGPVTIGPLPTAIRTRCGWKTRTTRIRSSTPPTSSGTRFSPITARSSPVNGCSSLSCWSVSRPMERLTTSSAHCWLGHATTMAPRLRRTHPGDSGQPIAGCIGRVPKQRHATATCDNRNRRADGASFGRPGRPCLLLAALPYSALCARPPP